MSRVTGERAEGLKAYLAKFAPVELDADLEALPESERRALRHLVEAARAMDGIFLEQVWAGNVPMLLDLADAEGGIEALERKVFLLNKGPWSRLGDNELLLAGAPQDKPQAANFYPPDATKEELERWIGRLSEGARREATGFFSVIRRAPDGSLTVVPYSVAYQGALGRAAAALTKAAEATRDPTLRRFLESRARAFATDDYYESDVAWMELTSALEPTIGPYEVYEDGLFNYKAAFEAFITVRDDAETEKLARLSAHLQSLEDALPIPEELKNPELGALAPIRVVNSVYSAGDANRGIQTAAYNLPNDERITAEKGAKRTMLKNIQEAKFEKVLRPIAEVALAEADRSRVSFDAFFTHILMHELMHGLGPHNIEVDGRTTTVRQALRETSSAIEEAKADISGLWALQQLIDAGVLSAELSETMYVTYLASTFRSIRFGASSAHGRGIALQLNFLLDEGAVRVAEDGTFHVVQDRIAEAVSSLTGRLMTLQASGDREAAQALLAKMAVVRPEVQRVVDRLEDVPVDIAPRFVAAERLLKERGAP